MKGLVDIEGSFLNPEPYLWKCVSPDRRFLMAVSESGTGLFRAHVFDRKSLEPQWKGTYWTEIDHPSLTDTFEHARELAQEWLRSLTESPAA